MRMRLVRGPVGGGTSAAAIMTLVMVACATGTDSGVVGEAEGGIPDGSRGVVVIPDDSGRPDTSTADGEQDAGVDSAGPVGTHIVINEVQTAGTGPDDEFVELFNPTGVSVSLAKWEIRYASGGGGAGGAGHVFNGTASINAGAYLVLKPSNSTWTFGMAGSDGQLGLFDGAGTGAKRVDGIGYGTVSGGSLSYKEGQAGPSPPSGGSVGRSPNGTDSDDNKSDFKTYTTASPGAANN